MFNKKCKASDCKNEISGNIEGMYSTDTPSGDMGWTTVKFCSEKCMKAFKKEKDSKWVTWGNEWK